MITEIVDTIALIPEEIIRLVYVKECSKLLEMDERVLVRNIARKRQELLLQKKKTLYPDPEQPEENRQAPPLPTPEDSPEEQNVFLAGKFSLFEHEKAILYYIVRYGEQVLYVAKEEATGANLPVKVIEYIVKDLNTDELVFSHPLYRQLLEEAAQRHTEENFVAETCFTNHPDPALSRLAVDLSTSKYIESKVHFKHKKKEEETEKLTELIPYVLHNYKDAIVRKEIDDLNTRIKEAETSADFELLKDLILQLSEKERMRKKLALNLRERIIPK
jgi:DNA primase